MNEAITKATQNMQFVQGDIMAACMAATRVTDKPQGLNMHDKALTAYLGDCLRLARELQSKLLVIAD